MAENNRPLTATYSPLGTRQNPRRPARTCGGLLDEPVPHPADVLAEQDGAEFLQPGGGLSSARMIASRSGIVSGHLEPSSTATSASSAWATANGAALRIDPIVSTTDGLHAPTVASECESGAMPRRLEGGTPPGGNGAPLRRRGLRGSHYCARDDLHGGSRRSPLP